MAYVDIAQLPGISDWLRLRTFAERFTKPTVVKAAPSIAPLIAMPRRPAVVSPLVTMPLRPTLEPPVTMPRRPAVLAPLVTMPLRLTLIRPAVVPALTTAIRLAKTKILKALPVTFKPNGTAPAPALHIKAPGGEVYKTTQAEVVPGADPVSASITGAGAPITGQSISLKETDPVVPLTATQEGVTITDETVPTFIGAAALEPSPFMKYGLLALGGYILYDTFVKSKPKTRKRRRRRRR